MMKGIDKMEKERKTQSASPAKKTVSRSDVRSGHIARSDSADNKATRQGKKEPTKTASVTVRDDDRKETKKQYVNKPSPTRQVTVKGNQKLGKNGKVNAGNESVTEKTKEKEKIGTNRSLKSEKTTGRDKNKNLKENKKAKVKTTAKKTEFPLFPMFLIFVLSIVIISGTVAIFISCINLPKKGKKVSLQYDLYGEKIKKTVTADQVLRDGKNVYLCLNDFSEKIGLRILGNEESAILYTDKGDSVSIENGSYRAVINGVPFELPGDVIIEGKNIYVPAALLFDFADGLEITYNFSTRRMNISTIKDDERSTSIMTVYKDFVFTPHEVAPVAPLDPD